MRDVTFNDKDIFTLNFILDSFVAEKLEKDRHILERMRLIEHSEGDIIDDLNLTGSYQLKLNEFEKRVNSINRIKRLINGTDEDHFVELDNDLFIE